VCCFARCLIFEGFPAGLFEKFTYYYLFRKLQHILFFNSRRHGGGIDVYEGARTDDALDSVIFHFSGIIPPAVAAAPLIAMTGVADLSTSTRLLLPSVSDRHQQLHEGQPVTFKPNLRSTQSQQGLPKLLHGVCKE
jgi:hypothetical protein